MDEKTNLKIVLEFKGCVCCLTFKNENNETVEFKDLNYRLKMRVVNCFRQSYDCLMRSLKEK